MAGKSNIRDKAKLLWIKGMKTIGNTATNIANNTKYKVDEMTLQNRRRELGGRIASPGEWQQEQRHLLLRGQ